MKGLTVSAALLAALKIVWSGLKFVAEIIGKLIFYLGLWVPLLYAVYGVALYLGFGFLPFSSDENSLLYLVGLALSVVIAALLAVRNIVVRPFKKYFKRTDVVDYNDESGNRRVSRHAPEAPKIYMSRVNPGITVYEYSNRYDLYERRDDRLKLVSTEYKGRRKRY